MSVLKKVSHSDLTETKLCRSIPKYHRSVFVTYMYHIKPWFSVLVHTRTNFKAFKRLLIGYKNQILNKK